MGHLTCGVSYCSELSSFRPTSEVSGTSHELLQPSETTGGNTVLNRRALFVVIPCLDHDKRQRIIRGEILVPGG
jgi:hypothetical protein